MESGPGSSPFSGVAGVLGALAALITAATGAWIAVGRPASEPAEPRPIAALAAPAPTAASTPPPPAVVIVQAGPQPQAVDMGAAGPPAHAAPLRPSFDCGRAATLVERTICGDPLLAVRDGEMAALYRDALGAAKANGGAGPLRADQRGWIQARNRCGAEADIGACLIEAYSARIAELQGS